MKLEQQLKFLCDNFAVLDDEQNDLLLYQKIHNKFKLMVNALMEGFCIDLSIEVKQLVSALKHHDYNQKLSTKERVCFF